MDGMETITVYCCNHQCVRNHRCARYTRNHKLVGMKIVKRYNCQGGENHFVELNCGSGAVYNDGNVEKMTKKEIK